MRSGPFLRAYVSSVALGTLLIAGQAPVTCDTAIAQSAGSRATMEPFKPSNLDTAKAKEIQEFNEQWWAKQRKRWEDEQLMADHPLVELILAYIDPLAYIIEDSIKESGLDPATAQVREEFLLIVTKALQVAAGTQGWKKELAKELLLGLTGEMIKLSASHLGTNAQVVMDFYLRRIPTSVDVMSAGEAARNYVPKHVGPTREGQLAFRQTVPGNTISGNTVGGNKISTPPPAVVGQYKKMTNDQAAAVVTRYGSVPGIGI